jgi:hypothetical protein
MKRMAWLTPNSESKKKTLKKTKRTKKKTSPEEYLAATNGSGVGTLASSSIEIPYAI